MSSLNERFVSGEDLSTYVLALNEKLKGRMKFKSDTLPLKISGSVRTNWNDILNITGSNPSLPGDVYLIKEESDIKSITIGSTVFNDGDYIVVTNESTKDESGTISKNVEVQNLSYNNKIDNFTIVTNASGESRSKSAIETNKLSTVASPISEVIYRLTEDETIGDKKYAKGLYVYDSSATTPTWIAVGGSEVDEKTILSKNSDGTSVPLYTCVGGYFDSTGEKDYVITKATVNYNNFERDEINNVYYSYTANGVSDRIEIKEFPTPSMTATIKATIILNTADSVTETHNLSLTYNYKTNNFESNDSTVLDIAYLAGVFGYQYKTYGRDCTHLCFRIVPNTPENIYTSHTITNFEYKLSKKNIPINSLYIPCDNITSYVNNDGKLSSNNIVTIDSNLPDISSVRNNSVYRVKDFLERVVKNPTELLSRKPGYYISNNSNSKNSKWEEYAKTTDSKTTRITDGMVFNVLGGERIDTDDYNTVRILGGVSRNSSWVSFDEPGYKERYNCSFYQSPLITTQPVSLDKTDLKNSFIVGACNFAWYKQSGGVYWSNFLGRYSEEYSNNEYVTYLCMPSDTQAWETQPALGGWQHSTSLLEVRYYYETNKLLGIFTTDNCESRGGRTHGCGLGAIDIVYKNHNDSNLISSFIPVDGTTITNDSGKLSVPTASGVTITSEEATSATISITAATVGSDTSVFTYTGLLNSGLTLLGENSYIDLPRINVIGVPTDRTNNANFTLLEGRYKYDSTSGTIYTYYEYVNGVKNEYKKLTIDTSTNTLELTIKYLFRYVSSVSSADIDKFNITKETKKPIVNYGTTLPTSGYEGELFVLIE